MEEYYTISDIISGLKPEYLKTKEELKSLKKYLNIFLKNLDIDFYVQTNGFDYPKMFYKVCFMVKSDELTKIDNMLGKNVFYKSPVYVRKIGNMYIVPDQHVLVIDDIKFSNKVDEILNCEFIKNINYNNVFDNFRLNIDSNCISFGNSDKSFNVDASKGDFSVLSFPNELLSYEINQSLLPEYYIETIEKNKCLKK